MSSHAYDAKDEKSDDELHEDMYMKGTMTVSRSGRLGSNDMFSFDRGSVARYELPPSKELRRRKHRVSPATRSNKSSIRDRGNTSSRNIRSKKITRIKDVKSGQDAIRFFALHGNDTPIKFLHFNRVRSAREFKPYELERVPQSKVDPEHFTISSAGVVRVCAGEPSEFTPLPDWMRELTIFNIIRSINFFKYYHVIKMFRKWRNNVRFKLYCNQRRKLASKLFLAKPTFCQPLLRVNACLKSLQNVNVLDLSGSKAFEASAFMDTQAVTREEASKTFDDIMEKAFAVVRDVCQKVSASSKAFRQNDDDGDDDSSPKHKSIVQMKQYMKDRRRRQLRADREAEMLGTFVRLCDYVTVENLLQLSIETNADFLRVLTGSQKRSGLFEVSVRFNDNGCAFSPTGNELQGYVRQTSKAMVDMLHSIPRVLYTQPFNGYISQDVSQTALKVAEVIRNSNVFIETQASIQRKLSYDFAKASDYTTVFENLRPIYHAEKTWDFEAYKTSENVSGVSIRQDLARVSGWERDVEKMKPQQIVGTLYVESRRLRQSLTPTIEGILCHLKELLASIAGQSCEEILTQYKSSIDTMSSRPETVRAFADYIKKTKTVHEKRKEMSKQAESVEDMYRVLEAYNVKVSTDASVKLDALRDTQTKFSEEQSLSSEFKTQKLPGMGQTLNAHIDRLDDNLETMQGKLRKGKLVDPDAEPSVVLKKLDTYKKQIESCKELALKYRTYQGLFDVAEGAFSRVKETEEVFQMRFKLWETFSKWKKVYDDATNKDFVTDVNAENLDTEVQILFKNAYMFDKKINDAVSARLKEEVLSFKKKMSVVLLIGNPKMKERHWSDIFLALNATYVPNFSLKELQEYGVFDPKLTEAIEEISGKASGEAALEESLAEIVSVWKEQEYLLAAYRDMKNVYILGDLEEVFQLLEDHHVTLQTMLGSRFIHAVRESVELWYGKLRLLSDTLDEWVACQKQWMYLETIFCAEDIQKQLPEESKKFFKVDKSFKTLMRRTSKYPGCLEPIETGNRVLLMLKESNAELERIQKSLEEYLETKRAAFPRFYFLSNEELLEILSQTRDPQAVQPHLGKCFDAIGKLEFRNQIEMHAMIGSGKPERVPFSEPVMAEGPVEHWLLAIEAMMRSTLYDTTKRALLAYPDKESAINREDWLFSYPAMVVLVIDQIFWSRNTEDAIEAIHSGENKNAMKEYYSYLLRQIDAMVKLVRGKLPKLHRTMLGALMILDVHARDVVKAMNAKGVNALTDFEWTRQLRYYWEKDVENVVIRQTNTRFVYAYEYLGNGGRLVITPLTDMIYMTLTGAVHLRFGGAPAGPAGTGKTETTKDLAKVLAIQCVVFNCSDQLDFQMMGRFFSGLIQSGAWACFDEFNRIDIEVLSVIAQQIITIQKAIVQELPTFEFEGKIIPRGENFGVFITMNPGYAGRTELPDNLKALFRPVACMVPDYRMIAEIMLFSQGFGEAETLSNKMKQLYQLASEQLSKQDHYDFGMRAVKSVLVAAGKLKQKEPETNENLLLIRAMRDSNVPKFLECDLPLFYGILKDLFPGVDVPFVDYGKLQKAIENQCELANLQCVPKFVSKVIQTHETQIVRHGMMLVGETGSGKSENIRMLAAALTQLHREGVKDKDNLYRPIDIMEVNPKSITAGELYGETNLMTGEWSDGIIPKLVRRCVTEVEDGRRKWVTFNGPVDTLWIESLNTVLDDNKTLCLANSERIKLPPTIHMMFEVEDLAVASPATVSRCGMVFMETVHVGKDALCRSWASSESNLDLFCDATDAVVRRASKRNASDTMVDTKREADRAFAKRCLDKLRDMILVHVDSLIRFVRRECFQHISGNEIQLTQSFLNFTLSILLINKDDLRRLDDLDDALRRIFLFAVMWSFGGNVDDASRSKFNDFVLRHIAPPLCHDKEKLNEMLSTVPEKNLYKGFVDIGRSGFTPWTDITDSFEYDIKVPYFSLVVPTEDTTRYRYLSKALLTNAYPLLLVGQTGVGKSVILQSLCNDLVATEAYASITVNYSAQTSPKNLVTVFEAKLEQKRKNLFGAPVGKKMLCFVDDLNMPAQEEYFAQPCNELLRQVMSESLSTDICGGGYYDTTKLFWKSIKDVTVLSACAPPGGGRKDVTARLTRLFNMIWLTDLSSVSMRTIFSSILSGFLGVVQPSLQFLASPITKASVEIYKLAREHLLPTPAKSHYTFNLRDLSKVFQGMLMVVSNDITDQKALLSLWCHEQCRVLRDRLIDGEDRAWFNTSLQKMLKDYMATEWSVDSFRECLWGSFESKGGGVYKPIAVDEKLSETLIEYLEEYNISFPTSMELVFFRDAIMHLSRVARVLGQPRGNALLVGVGGSGRKSLTRLACFVLDIKCVSIEISRGYGHTEWREDLKGLLRIAGAENKKVAFLFSDTQIIMESCLEDINNLLNSGEVPNLFESDEIDNIVELVRPHCKRAGLVDTRDNILAHFVTQTRENLHIVLAFSPIGKGFRSRCLMFPSLVNCCTIDWYNAWPKEALQSVAMKFLQAHNTERNLGIAQFISPLCDLAVRIHRSVEKSTESFLTQCGRYNYTTPTSYLELINSYTNKLESQGSLVQSAVQRYNGGLEKIRYAEGVVSQLKIDLTALKPKLMQAEKDTNALLERLKIDQKKAAEAKEIAMVDEAEASKVAENVKVIKNDCQKDLDEALPAYYSAIKALDSLDKSKINEVKSFKNPPLLVGVTMEAVCILLGKKPEWKEGQKLLSDMNFMKTLMEYDKDNIEPKRIRKLQKYIKREDFTAEKVGKTSAAAKCICLWVLAMNTYNRVAKKIEPKKAALKEAEQELVVVMEKLELKREDLRKVEEKLAALQAQFEQSLREKDRLQAEMKLTEDRLGRAVELTSGLAGEKARWTVRAKQLSKDYENLVGNMMVAAGCISYSGPFTRDYRESMMKDWVDQCVASKIPVDPDFALIRILGDPVLIRKWGLNGLPLDDFSVQNGLLNTQGRRWSLMIDPQGQANLWIKKMYTKKLKVIKLTEANFLRTLENGIRYGNPVLCENIEEELDPSLEPVLLKQTFKRGGQTLLRLGDTDVPYQKEFRFFMTTKLPNPHYMPEVFIKVTIINFTVTPMGLENQLLVDVVRSERPDLEEKKDKLTLAISKCKDQLQAIEDKILQQLANSEGNILDDQALIDNLKNSKKTATVINKTLAEAETTSKQIDTARESYRPVAKRGSVLYFVIASLSHVDPMYQYSLQYFKALYNLRMRESEKSDDVQKRIDIMIEDITRSMYVNVCQGLFEKDKLAYAFQMAVRIMLKAGKISDAEWKYFVIGGTSVPEEKELPCPKVPIGKNYQWLREKWWTDVVRLEHSGIDAFRGLTKSVAENMEEWHAFLTHDSPEAILLPCGWEKRVSNFLRALLLRTVMPEKITFVVRKFVGDELGSDFKESPPFDLEKAFLTSTCHTPLIFILSPGADINDALMSLADQKGKSDVLKIVSLGQGQGPIAESMMEVGREDGHWVCLQNCHLSVSWLPRLQEVLESVTGSDDTHEEYRLWLTSNPSKNFPVPILQNGVKITNEPPKGLKMNLKRTFLDMSEEYYEECTKPRAWKKLLFAVSFYNAIALERRKFGAIGWNIPTGWMNSDLKTAFMQLKNYLEEQPVVPYETLNVMIGAITFGGRVTDKQDKRANITILSRYIVPSIMEDDYKLSDSGIYFAPPEGKLDDVRRYIETLPGTEKPEAYGLHDNADITFYIKESRNLLGTLTTMEGTGSGGGDDASEKDATVLALVDEMLKRMPPPMDVENAHPLTIQRISDGSMNSLGVFVVQEASRFNTLRKVVMKSLVEMKKAIKGLVVMSMELEDMYHGILFQRVPKKWESAAYPSLKPLAPWIEDMFLRLDDIGSWLKNGPPVAYWVPGFFFPQGFVTGVLQTYSRATKTAVDVLTIDTIITDMMSKDDIKQVPEHGVYVFGLHMQGACFDTKRMLMDESPPRELFSTMPIMHFNPITFAQYSLGTRYECPLYKTSRRAGTLSTTGHSTNFVRALAIPTDVHPDHWIRRGVALLCMLDD